MSAARDMPSKLMRLTRDCARLETLRQLSLETFLQDPAVQDQVCYLLLTTYEGALNIGTELLEILGLPRPEYEAAIFSLLAQEEVLSPTCVSQLTAMHGLCNSLSQEYGELDLRWLYQTLQINLAGLNQFAGQVQAFLDK